MRGLRAIGDGASVTRGLQQASANGISVAQHSAYNGDIRVKYMRKSKTARGWLRALAAAVCMALLLSGCQIGDKEFVISKALNSRQVFKIGRSVCKLKEAKVYLANYQNIYGTAYSIWISCGSMISAMNR